jgi:hypothetical protein
MISRRVLTSLALAGLVAVQISCGGDSSGPGASASSIAANSSTTIGAAPGTQVAELPSVLVSDAAGNPLGGVPVTFAVTSGGGSITGSSASSGSDGIATVGSWTLGQTAGVNTLTATVAGLPAVTFTAQGADPCAAATPHTLGSMTSGALSLSDCRLSDGSFVDFYTVSVPAAGTYTFTQTGNFDTYLALLTSSSSVIAINDDFGAPTTSTVKVLLPAGNFLIGANSYDPNVTGTYTVSSASSTTQITNCEDAFVLVGSNSDQSLQSTDCVANNFFSDDYLIFLLAGQGITALMSSASIDSYLEIRADGNSTVLASNDNIDGSTQNARVAFTAPSTAFYIIKARTPTANVTGSYTIAVQ